VDDGQVPVVDGLVHLKSRTIIVRCPVCNRIHLHYFNDWDKVGDTVERKAHCSWEPYKIRIIGEVDDKTYYSALEDVVFQSDKSYTPSQVANILGIGKTTVLQWIRAGKLYAIRTLGGHFRVPREEVARLYEKNEYKEYFTTYEVAKILGVYPSTVWEWIQKGKVQAEKVGSRYIIHRSEVVRLLKVR